MKIEILLDSNKMILEDKPINRQYAPSNGIFLGEIKLVDYGYNYIGSKQDPINKRHTMSSTFIEISDKVKYHETMEQAREAAILVAKYILKNKFKLQF